MSHFIFFLVEMPYFLSFIFHSCCLSILLLPLALTLILLHAVSPEVAQPCVELRYGVALFGENLVEDEVQPLVDRAIAWFEGEAVDRPKPAEEKSQR